MKIILKKTENEIGIEIGIGKPENQKTKLKKKIGKTKTGKYEKRKTKIPREIPKTKIPKPETEMKKRKSEKMENGKKRKCIDCRGERERERPTLFFMRLRGPSS